MGRFFSDPGLLEKIIEKAHAAYRAAVKSRDPATASRAPNVFAAAVAANASGAVAKRTLELFDELSARIHTLEKAPFAYAGTYESGKAYGKNELVTFDGSMWIALKQTARRPGGDDWQLCVKRGRDAR